MASILLTFGGLFSQDKYTYTVDLTKVQNDKVPVELETPQVTQGAIEFQMPKVVPGTYSISDFGLYITEFKAMDENGNELPVTRTDGDPNRWKIEQADQLDKITYLVDDTWDSELDNDIFEPGGTNIEAGANFVLNTFGFFGYLEGMKEKQFDLVVKKPAGFYGSTALIAAETGATADRYEVKDYNLLADSPIMYCVPDTVVKNVGGADVLVSVYSPNGKTTAAGVMESIAPILEAQRKYLGGTLPVKKYAFICYFVPMGQAGGGMGALEHSYSSFYFLPEIGNEAIAGTMKDVAAHEFFHIVTPLNVHSEEIHYFDFIDPKMSKHLWLYEGVTEYSAGHVQICYDLIGLDAYLDILSQKMMTAQFFSDDVPFTEISAGCLDEHARQYGNVYMKGALIGATLDITLRDLSDGKMGMQDLMRKMEKTYGIEQPFEDDKLFDKITELTFPEVRNFFTQYVEGPNPLPFEDVFAKVGIRYEENVDRRILTMGRIRVKIDEEKDQVIIVNQGNMNRFGKDMGWEDGDVLRELAGMEVNTKNYYEVLEKYRTEFDEGDKIKAVVDRPDGNGGYATKKLKGKAMQVRQRAPYLLTPMTNPTDRQMAIRDSWLNNAGE